MSAAAPIFHSALLADTLAALDHAESVHRLLQRTRPAHVGLPEDTFALASASVQTAYEALCLARQLIEGQS